MTTVDHPEPLTATAPRGACPFDPPPAHERARRERPVARVTLWDGSSCWLVTRHQDVRAVLADRRFSADSTRPGFPFVTEARKAVATDNLSFVRMDDPEHARLRRMLTGDFLIRKVEALRPRVQEMADGFLDRMAADRPPADLVAAFALPIPSLVICLLLGVPYADHAYFQGLSHTMFRNDTPPAEVEAATRGLITYLTGLAKAKRKAPDDAIISRLVARNDLTDVEIARMGRLLLVAGHETTANMISLSVLALLREPGQAERLRADPALIGGAVEELLRWLTIIHAGTGRVATEDVEVGGQLVRAGEGVLCMLATANRDDAVFAAGGELDVGRDARRHLAFGFGPHQCLGQQLARMELQVALGTILRRMPGLRLAEPFEDVAFRHDMTIYGVHRLMVGW
jgi:cytochrome P450